LYLFFCNGQTSKKAKQLMQKLCENIRNPNPQIRCPHLKNFPLTIENAVNVNWLETILFMPDKTKPVLCIKAVDEAKKQLKNWKN
jgi:hypothetical protein